MSGGDLLRTSPGAAVYLRRPEKSFAGLHLSLRGYLESGPLAHVPPGEVLLYGSFVRSAWTREGWADVNVAFRSEEARAAVASLLDPRAGIVVSERTFATPAALLDEADFTICQLVYHEGMLHYPAVYFEHLAQKLLIVNRLSRVRAAATLLRLCKYLRRGYAVPAAELAKVMEHVEPGELTGAGLDLGRHAAGAVV